MPPHPRARSAASSTDKTPISVPAPETTSWFNRVLNIIHHHAPEAQIILVRDPADVWACYANDPEEGAFARAVPSYERTHRLNRRYR